MKKSFIVIITLLLILLLLLCGCIDKTVISNEKYEINSEEKIITFYANAAKFAEDQFPIFQGSERIVYDTKTHSGPNCWQEYPYSTGMGAADVYKETKDRISFSIELNLDELNTNELYYYRTVII
jgi:hypothetical protein